jgi:PAS domain-containing protein
VDYDYDTSYEKALKNIEPDSRQLLVENINNIIENGGAYDLILKHIYGDKKLKWVRAIGQSNKDGQGKTQRIYGVLQDITEEQETKKTLSRINQQMKL